MLAFMGYAILRVQKLKSAVAVHRSMKHAFRAQETPNADKSRTPDNTHIGAHSVAEGMAAFREALPEKVRKNAVQCVEYLMTASPEAMQGKTREQQDAYFQDSLDWLRKRHGAENVIYAGIHRDEKTPHMYAYVVPKDPDTGRLNCRRFLGGAAALREMQTDFAEQVGKQHGLQRGIEGSKAK
ncbi:MobV family relaxase, partial [Proteus mirabilis]